MQQAYNQQSHSPPSSPSYLNLLPKSPACLISKHKPPDTSPSIHQTYLPVGQQTQQNNILHLQQSVHFVQTAELLQAPNHCIICLESLVISFLPLNHPRPFHACYLIPQLFNQFSLYPYPANALLYLLLFCPRFLTPISLSTADLVLICIAL